MPESHQEYCDNCQVPLSYNVTHRRRFNFLSRIHNTKVVVRDALQAVFPFNRGCENEGNLQSRNLCQKCCSILGRIYRQLKEFRAAAHPASFSYSKYILPTGAAGALPKKGGKKILEVQPTRRIIPLPLDRTPEPSREHDYLGVATPSLSTTTLLTPASLVLQKAMRMKGLLTRVGDLNPRFDLNREVVEESEYGSMMTSWDGDGNEDSSDSEIDVQTRISAFIIAQRRNASRARRWEKKPMLNHGPCPYCGKVLMGKHKNFVLQHIRLFHKDRSLYPCSVCLKPNPDKTTRRRHERTHVKVDDGGKRQVNPKKYQCPECGKLFTTQHSMLAHQKLFHEACPDALRRYRAKNVERKTYKARSLLCSTCEKPCPSRQSRSRHERSHLNVAEQKELREREGLLCADCGKILVDERNLTAHRRTFHSGSEQVRYACKEPDCTFSCLKIATLKRHRNQVHDPTAEPKYKCKVCGKAFRVFKELRDHRLSERDSESRPFLCRLDCPRRYKTRWNLTSHYIQVHKLRIQEARMKVNQEYAWTTQPKEPKLPRIKRSSAEKETENSGQRDKERELVVKIPRTRNRVQITHPPCPHCGKVLVSVDKDALKLHIQVSHEHRSNFPCPICAKPCYNKMILEEHQRSHLNAKERALDLESRKAFLCEECGKVFLDKKYLNDHIRKLHKGMPRKKPERVYCLEPDCDYSCADRRRLQDHHSRMHEPVVVRPKYDCKHCQQSFQYFHQLKEHEMTVCELQSRPFACDQPNCPRRFTCKQNLFRHLLLLHRLNPEDGRQRVYPGMKCPDSVYRMLHAMGRETRPRTQTHPPPTQYILPNQLLRECDDGNEMIEIELTSD